MDVANRGRNDGLAAIANIYRPFRARITKSKSQKCFSATQHIIMESSSSLHLILKHSAAFLINFSNIPNQML